MFFVEAAFLSKLVRRQTGIVKLDAPGVQAHSKEPAQYEVVPIEKSPSAPSKSAIDLSPASYTLICHALVLTQRSICSTEITNVQYNLRAD